jgi:hypothetical protein
MVNLGKFVIACVFFIVPFTSHAEMSQAQIKDKMIADLDVIQQTFEVNYAPKEWKKSFADWDLLEQIQLAKVKILEKERISVKEYQHIVRDFFNSTQDYHVGVKFFSTEVAALPFRMTSTHGRYFVAWSLKNHWEPLMDYSLDVGDEVLLFNNQPIDLVVQEFKLQEFGNPNSLTDQALAESEITVRTGYNGNTTPQGTVLLTVRKKGTEKIETYQLQWAYMPEMVSDNFVTTAKKPKQMAKNRPLGEHPFFQKDMSTHHFDHQKTSSKLGLKALKKLGNFDQGEEDEADDFLGSKQSVLPYLGRTTWRSDPKDPIDAYIYMTPSKKRIGYFRIPHYMLGEDEVNNLIDIISLFQSKTDALIIDQLNNPGGSMFFMYSIISMLSDQAMLAPKERMMISSSDVFFALETIDELEAIQNDEEAAQVIGKTIGGLPVTYALVQNIISHFKFLINEWYDGRVFTQAEYLYGIDYIQPHPKVRYTKPIIILVNSLDFSCGDFFPATLQDNNRATIVGTQTAGAGGYVIGHEFSNLFGVAAFRFTGSIAERINNNPIENLGVTPDIWLEMTPNDLEFNYGNYVKELNKIVEKLF